ncbi:glycosyltransferase [Escherichia coli]|nr:glycosyltransferase [Escherichia coli]
MVDKIIFTVTPIFSIPPRGAAAVETWMYQVAQRTNFPNRIVCIKNPGYSNYTFVNDNCSIHRVGFSRIYKRLFQKWTRLDPLPYSQRILNIAHDFPITKESVIVVHNSMKLYTQIRKRAPQARVVIHMHNAFEPKLLEQNVKMIVPSLYLKKYYQSYLANADIEIVPNGIDLETYQSNFQPITRSELNISPEEKIIFYAGRIVPDKGAYQRNVREIAKRLKDRCIMLGSIPPEKMHCYYPLADLVVIPSQFQEPFCMVAIEAMGAGKPVLVSTRGGMTEFVKENTTGFHLKEPMTADSISSDILKTLANPELTAVAKQGQDFVFEHYSWDGVTQRFEEVIHNWFE